MELFNRYSKHLRWQQYATAHKNTAFLSQILETAAFTKIKLNNKYK